MSCGEGSGLTEPYTRGGGTWKAGGVIDFNNATFAKLSPWDLAQVRGELDGMLVENEVLHLTFKGLRDSVTFTNRRVVALNVQGITGKKRDYTSLPYSRVQAFSVETAGTLDLDSELVMWFSGVGRVKLEFARGVDIRVLGRLLADHVLGVRDALTGSVREAGTWRAT